MSIDSICSGCGRTLRVADEYAGLEAQCPACSTIYRVPAASNANPAINSSGTLVDPYSNVSSNQRFYAQTPSGVEYGPVELETMLRWYAEGRVNATCTVRGEVDTRRIPFAQWLASTGVSKVEPQSSTFARAGTFANTDGTNTFGNVPALRETEIRYQREGRGVLILVLACASWAACIVLIGAIPIASVALYLGFSDLRAMKRGEMSPKDRGLVLVGLWLAGFSLFLSLAFTLLWLVVTIANL
jgi:phage FluMu protein Com